MTKTYVYIRTQFEAFHRWKDAPEDVAFLREYHRHIFHVKVTVAVSHDNRDIEFFQLKRIVDEWIRRNYHGQQFEMSCEQLALGIMTMDPHFRIYEVEVSEDGENGAVVTYIPSYQI